MRPSKNIKKHNHRQKQKQAVKVVVAIVKQNANHILVVANHKCISSAP